jgi:hypothetical protein
MKVHTFGKYKSHIVLFITNKILSTTEQTAIEKILFFSISHFPYSMHYFRHTLRPRKVNI